MKKVREGAVKGLSIAGLVLVMMFLMAGVGQAAEFHSTTAVEFQIALVTAESNGEDDTIFLSAGTYEGGFVFTTTEAMALTIKAEPGLTAEQVVLDGNNLNRVLLLQAGTNVVNFTLEKITIQNGKKTFGAGIYVKTAGNLDVTNSVFTGSSATGGNGGGVFITDADSINFTNSDFSSNSTSCTAKGGGVHCNAFGGGVYIDSSVNIATLTNNNVVGNSSYCLSNSGSVMTDVTCYSYGGGVYVNSDTITTSNNVIAGNTASCRASMHAICDSAGAGIHITPISSLTLINDSIVNNSATCSKYSNTRDKCYAIVGGVLLQTNNTNSALNISNSIIRGNTATNTGDIYIKGDGSNVRLYNNNYSSIFGTPAFTLGRLNVDPLFVNAADNYHLKHNSPAINAGTNQAPGLPNNDKDGNLRILDSTVDMGAYEYTLTISDSIDPVTDQDIPFGDVVEFTTSNQTVTVTNFGTATLDIGAISQLVAPFTIIQEDCFDQTLAPAASCTITVQFAPDARVTSNDTFDIPFANSNYDTVTITLSGTGIPNPLPDITIADITVNEGDSGTTNAIFTVTLSAPSDQDVTVDYITTDGSAFGDDDYVSISTTTLTIPAGVTSGEIAVTINGDALYELDEDFFLDLSNAVNGNIIDDQAKGTITNDDPKPSFSIDDASINEDTGNAVFTVTLSAVSGLPASVDYVTSNGTAIAGSDYTAISFTTLDFAAGETTKTITVSITGDSLYEGNETYYIDLSNAVNTTINDNRGVGSILNDDPMPSFSIDDVSVNEDTGNAVFTVSLSTESGLSASVDYITADGTATAGSDYTASNLTTLDFAAGETTKTITVSITGGTLYEGNETYYIDLSNAVNATINNNRGDGIILNDDPMPSITINDVSVNEGVGNAVFTVTLTPASGLPASVNYETSNGTATAGDDYTALNLTRLDFAAGETAKTITVIITGDTKYENDETFSVKLSSPVNATLPGDIGVGTITNDDPLPSLTIGNAPLVTEGETSEFQVCLSEISGLPASFNFNTADVTAVAGEDYTAVVTGSRTIEAGNNCVAVISIGTIDDNIVDEPDETFNVVISNVAGASLADDRGEGTIKDNDPPLPVLSINNVSLNEGDEGTSIMDFTVLLSEVSDSLVTVSYVTANGDAVAGSDYEANSGALTFEPGDTIKTIQVSIKGDKANELDEDFYVELSNPLNAVISPGAGTGTGTVENDDMPEIVVSDSDVPSDDLRIFFGEVSINGSSSHVVTISNTGNSILTIGEIISPAAPFNILELDNCSQKEIASEDSCLMIVEFSPAEEVYYEGISFSIPSDDDDEDPVTITLSGTGVTAPAPDIDVTDSTYPAYDHGLPFGSVSVNSSLDEVLYISNKGDADLIIGEIPLGLLAGQIELRDNFCSGQTVMPGGDCSITVRYSPDSEGKFNGTFTIPSNDPDEGEVTIWLSGTGIEESAQVADIKVTDTVVPTGDHYLPFGNITVNNSPKLSVSITNEGNGDLLIGQIGGTNPLNDPFRIYLEDDTCSNQTIPSGEKCTILVTFSPLQQGVFIDSFEISSNDPDDEKIITVIVSGNGDNGNVPNILISDPALPEYDHFVSFDNVLEGSFLDRIVTISNIGNAPLEIGLIADTDILSGPFYIVDDIDNCSQTTVFQGENCTFTVRFSPDSNGSFFDIFDVPSNDPDTDTISVKVSGTGTEEIQPVPVVPPANSPPAGFSLVYPTDGQTALPIAFNFIWSQTTDTDGDPVNYTLYYCDNSDVESCGPVSASYASFFENKGIFYGSIAGNWIVLVIGMLLLTGSLKGKKGMGIYLLLIILMTGGGMGLSACGSSGGSDSDNNIGVPSPAQQAQPTSGDGQIGYAVTGLSSGTTYYWKVVATDGNGGSTESGIQSFTTQ